MSKSRSSWEPVSDWYDKLVGEEGHYYHQTVILPGLLRLLGLGKKQARLADFGCGQGILSRKLPPQVEYVGIDLSPSLVKAAQVYEQKNRSSSAKRPIFVVGDLQKPLVGTHPALESESYTHGVMTLALQNIEHGEAAVRHAAELLKQGGYLLLVVNHPCFRIPRQSSWGCDEAKKLQFRRVDRYMAPLSIPIQAHPGKGGGATNTWSYHHPLSHYVTWLRRAGCVVEGLEEWCSPKESEGAKAAMENRAREEFPLFLALLARKAYRLPSEGE